MASLAPVRLGFGTFCVIARKYHPNRVVRLAPEAGYIPTFDQSKREMGYSFVIKRELCKCDRPRRPPRSLAGSGGNLRIRRAQVVVLKKVHGAFREADGIARCDPIEHSKFEWWCGWGMVCSKQSLIRLSSKKACCKYNVYGVYRL